KNGAYTCAGSCVPAAAGAAPAVPPEPAASALAAIARTSLTRRQFLSMAIDSPRMSRADVPAMVQPDRIDGQSRGYVPSTAAAPRRPHHRLVDDVHRRHGG